ncbi:ZIP family metal transporter [Anaerocellum danielii]|uniref:ZIP family metal transporter n=1 Tax=Anaerocellum danielii TaxID=1387557 RepID=A0ABZ0U641_9FIRM|nr:ZIP family metal transporter [Caldicellulosiruptor danielii]WPX09780.1 ZIP family metal transporter [Caldicellulosiruptor danielii]
MKLVNFKLALLKINFLIFNLFGFFCGIAGAFVGALTGLVLPLNDEKVRDSLIGFTSGLMLGLICFGLIPEAVSISNLLVCILVLIASYFMIGILEKALTMRYLLSQNRYLKSGILILVALSLHNFPEGLAIGSSFAVEKSFGILVGIMIIIHDIPEGFVLSLPLKIAKQSKNKILKYAILSGVPTGIGCLTGSMISYINKCVVAGCLTCAAGAMLYVVMNELIPEYSRKENIKMATISNIMGIIIALLLLEWLEL